MSVLLVSALEEEAAALAPYVPVVHVGVGKVQAAAGLAAALDRSADADLVVNVGTAGGLHGQGIGTVVEVSRVWQHDFDHDAVCGFVGRPLPGGAIDLTGPSGAEGRLVTGDRLVADPREREQLGRVADVVDMEGYAIAATARALGREVWLVKAVSDGADDRAVGDWRSALARCSDALAAWADRAGLLA